MDNKNHSNQCSCQNNLSIAQTLDEIQFEKSIFNACVQGDIGKVRRMIEKNGKSIVNEQDKNGYSCLHYSARNSHYDICKFLIDNGINLNLKTFNQQSTALHRAGYMGNKQIVELLLLSGCDSTIKDCDGKNALHKCIEQYEMNKINPKNSIKYLDTIKILLKHNPDLKNQIDNSNKKPFEYCQDLEKNL